jgi:hypothetical protein
MLIIKNELGKIIGAQLEGAQTDGITVFITPSNQQHTLHRVADVPEEILRLSNPVEFGNAISAYVNSNSSKVIATNADDVLNHARKQSAGKPKS